jgi:hypothetical protein
LASVGDATVLAGPDLSCCELPAQTWSELRHGFWSPQEDYDGNNGAQAAGPELNVRFGSLADMQPGARNIRKTPQADRIAQDHR